MATLYDTARISSIVCQNEGESSKNGFNHILSIELYLGCLDKLQFAVGEILECREVENSKKLLCSQVKIGSEVKQILSGIRSSYDPEELVGKKVLVLTNLKPRKLAGLESEGMLLLAEDAEGTLSLLTPERDMPAGAPVE